MAISSILIGGGVSASAAVRSAPASAFTATKIGHGGGADQSTRSAASLCGFQLDHAPNSTDTATARRPNNLRLLHDIRLTVFAMNEVVPVLFPSVDCRFIKRAARRASEREQREQLAVCGLVDKVPCPLITAVTVSSHCHRVTVHSGLSRPHHTLPG